jgi:hypothetical protein
MSIYKKLFEAKKEIQQHPKIKPAGRNDFHKYDYITPSQVLSIVNPVLEKHGLFIEFVLNQIKNFPSKTSSTKTETKEGISITVKTEADTYDYIAVVDIFIHDIEKDEPQEITLEIPLDKFSPQGYGAVLTYVERYFYMKTFGLATDDDDPDTKEQKPKINNRPKI